MAQLRIALFLLALLCGIGVAPTAPQAAESVPTDKHVVIKEAAGFRNAAESLNVEIRGLDPEQLGNIVLLKMAKRILFTQCSVNKSVLEKVVALPDLAEIEFAGTKMSSGADLTILATSKTITSLSLWGGTETGVDYSYMQSIGSMSNLQSLELAGLDDIAEGQFEVLQHLTKLTSLSMRSCYALEDSRCAFFSKFQNLSRLSLWGVGALGTQFLTICAQLPVLRELTVSRLDGATVTNIALLESSPCLTRLEVGLPQSSADEILGRLVRSKRMSTLVVQGSSPAEGLFVEYLGSSVVLKSLALEGSFSRFNIESWQKLSEQESIEYLSIADPRVALGMLRTIARWKKLRAIRIRDGSQLSREDINKLCDGTNLESIEVLNIVGMSKEELKQLQERLQSLLGDQLKEVYLARRD